MGYNINTGGKYYKRSNAKFNLLDPMTWANAIPGLDNESVTSWVPLDDTYNNNLYNAVGNQLSGATLDFWNSLSATEKQDLLEGYLGDTESKYGKGYVQQEYDIDSLLDDLEELSGIGSMPDISEPVYGNYVQSSTDLYRDIDSELNPFYNQANQRLDEELALMRQDYQDQLQSSADMYNHQASGLLSNQYLSNAQTYDALQSDMRKARQNALEAGASAGIRLAGNVNALLTAQNKQSQTAMDTSNALAEMLLQQRNAAAGIRSDYRNYMSDVNQRKTNLDTQRRAERENLYNQRHSAQIEDYNTAQNTYNSKMYNWENEFNNVDPTNKAIGAYQAYMRNK